MRAPAHLVNFGSGMVFGVVALLVVQVAFPDLGPALERLVSSGPAPTLEEGPIEVFSVSVSDAPPSPTLRLVIVNHGESAVVVNETRLTVEERWRLLNPHCDEHPPRASGSSDLDVSVSRPTPSVSVHGQSFLVEPRNVTLKTYAVGNDADAHTGLAALRIRLTLPYDGGTAESPAIIVLAAKDDGELNYYFDGRFTCQVDRGKVEETTGLNRVILDRVGPTDAIKGPAYAEFEAAVRYLDSVRPE